MVIKYHNIRLFIYSIAWERGQCPWDLLRLKHDEQCLERHHGREDTLDIIAVGSPA